MTRNLLMRRLFFLILASGTWRNLAADYPEEYANLTPIQQYLVLNAAATYFQRYSNPAMLAAEFEYRSFYTVAEDGHRGDFRRPFTARARREYTATAGGQQVFGRHSLLAGSFSYRRQRLEDKMWVHNRAPYSGQPFLLADSSTGDFRLDGIFWEVLWSRNWIEQKLTSGIGLFYNVDEEYKMVFPKPQNKHRDLYLKAGWLWRPRPQFSIGLTVGHFDFQEILATTQYSLDQNRTPIFFKIRGLDNPLIFKGQTSEERLLAIQGFHTTLDFSATAGRHFLQGDLSYAGAKAQNTDGGAYPVRQGKWSSTGYAFRGEWLFRIIPTLSGGLFSTGAINIQEADHPELKMKIDELRTRALTGGISLPVRRRGWDFVPRLYYTSKMLKRTDFYNGILLYIPGDQLAGEIDCQVHHSPRWQLTLNSGFGQLAGRTSRIITERQDWYFQAITHNDIAYLQANQQQTWFELTGNWNTSNTRKYSAKMKYCLSEPVAKVKPGRQFQSLTLTITIENY